MKLSKIFKVMFMVLIFTGTTSLFAQKFEPAKWILQPDTALILVPPMAKFSSLLESRAYDNILLNCQVFDDETHMSVGPESLNRTLSVLYKKQRIPR